MLSHPSIKTTSTERIINSKNINRKSNHMQFHAEQIKILFFPFETEKILSLLVRFNIFTALKNYAVKYFAFT